MKSLSRRRRIRSFPIRLSLVRLEDRAVPATLQLSNITPLAARAGVTFNTMVATFTDSDGSSTESNFTGTINWGDGQTSQAGIHYILPPVPDRYPFFQVIGSHTFAVAGTYSIHVAIHDVDGDSAQTENSFAVAAPLVHYIAVGSGPGQAPEVKVYDAATGALKFHFVPYDEAFGGGVRVATADVNGDGVDDIITGAGPGGGPHVKVFDGITGNMIDSFFAYDASFTGGVFVAGGDVNGDGKADIITGAGYGGGPHVKAFSGVDLSVLYSFYAYAANFVGGVSVAAGDVNGVGFADIITGAGPGGGPHVKVFYGANLALVGSFYAFSPDFTGGVSVAAGLPSPNGGGAEIIAGAGPGSKPLVNVFGGAGANFESRGSFLAYPADFPGGVNVAIAVVGGNGKTDIVTGPALGGGALVETFDATSLTKLNSFAAFDPSFLGGVFVG